MKKYSAFLVIFVLLIFSAHGVEISAARQSFIDAAKVYLGAPYKYGGTSTSGIDCSGLVFMAGKNSGQLNLPRTVKAMYSYASKIEEIEREPGDLIFFGTDMDPSHVGIYLGSNKFIHAASEGSSTGVIISKTTEDYYKNNLFAYGRVLPETKKGLASAKDTINSDKNSYSFLNNTMAAVMGDWTFVQEDGYKGEFRGGTIALGLRLTSLPIKPGFIVKATYQFPDYFQIPVCLSIDFGDYVKIYGGATFSTSFSNREFPTISGYNDLKVPLFPGHFGIFLRTPGLGSGSAKYSLVQDISYTHYLNTDGQELSFRKQLAAGITLSTGLCITMY